MQDQLDEIIQTWKLGASQLSALLDDDWLDAAMEQRALDAGAAAEAIQLCKRAKHTHSKLEKPDNLCVLCSTKAFLNVLFCNSPGLEFLLTCTADQAVCFLRNRATSLADKCDQTSQADQMYMFLVDCELIDLYGANMRDDQKHVVAELQECVHRKLNQLIVE